MAISGQHHHLTIFGGCKYCKADVDEAFAEGYKYGYQRGYKVGRKFKNKSEVHNAKD